MQTSFVDVGTRVVRKHDGAMGVIIDRRPRSGQTVLSVRLDDATLDAIAGDDLTGDLGWFTAQFRAALPADAAVFTVWHRQQPTFRVPTPADVADFPAGFDRVAAVQCAELGAVFELTNHIDRAWWENAGVRKLVDRACRSTSVGDIVTHGAERWTVAPCGWERC